MRTLGWPSTSVTLCVSLILAGSDTRAVVFVDTSRWPESNVPLVPPRASTPPPPSAITAPTTAITLPPTTRPVRAALAESYVGGWLVIYDLS